MTALSRPRRYQVKKDAARIVTAGHPWLFRGQMSSAAEVFADGQWLRLFDGDNKVIGYGVYAQRGAIAIRVVRRGLAAPDAAWVAAQVDAAIARRQPLLADTDGYRVIHGESDGLPGVVIERLGPVLVVQSYASGMAAIARLAARLVAQRLALSTIVWRPARRVAAATEGDAPRALRGTLPPVVSLREGDLTIAVDVAGGQKSGTYLDLRGLRRTLRGLPLTGARVLNLFAYTGTAGLACERAGAAEIVEVDASATALALARERHAMDPAKHRYLERDIFGLTEAQLAELGSFDVVVCDPPAMTSRIDQVGAALDSYRRLYRRLAPHVAPGGLLVAACCTARIRRDAFRQAVRSSLGDGFRLERELPTEIDHPVTFAESDYLKVLCWRRAPDPATRESSEAL